MKRAVMRALKASVLCALTLVACADPPAPAAPSSKAATNKPAEDRYAELTANDCEKWADHFSNRLREATKRRIDECSDKVRAAGGVPSSDPKDLEETNKEADRLHGLIIEQCGQQVGAAYVRADAACYMGAKKMEDWKACPFESMFFADYKSVAKNHEKMFDERCRGALKASP
jgi:hypothetical protein